MKVLHLTLKKTAIVDDGDYERLTKYKWYAHFKVKWYAVRTNRVNGKPKREIMHRVILGINDPNIIIDHINGDGLDNRRENLRVCTRSQNRANSKKGDNKTSKYKGVVAHKKSGKWQAQILYNKRNIYLGLYQTQEEAAKAYNIKAQELFGKFSNLNILP